MAYIEIRNYSKQIKNNKVLDDISIDFEKGKVYGFNGRNGCGKSMLFKAICGLVYSKEGSIKIDGKVLFEDMDIPQSVGALIENPGFFPHLTGFENLKLLADINSQIGKEQIQTYLNHFHLDTNKKYKQYSLGMKQRLGIIQALMENPELIILDEPMNGLDDEHIDIVKDTILELRNKNKCILLASHSKEDLIYLCDEIYHMDKGKIKGRL